MTNPEGSAPAVPPPPADNRTLVLIAYGLFLAGCVTGGVAAIAGVILAYVKRGEVAGTVWASHYENLILVFWVGLAGSILGIITTFILIGFLVLLAVFVWYLYRTIVGLLKAVENKPYDNPSKLI